MYCRKIILLLFAGQVLEVWSQGSDVPEICQQPQVVGHCRGALPRFWFNMETGKCEKFSYGGCKGNKNNFKQESDCVAACVDKTQLTSMVKKTQQSEAVCTLPQEVGDCRAAFPRFWYNITTKSCEDFIYGGCGGNGNNFERESECLRTCRERGSHVDSWPIPKGPGDSAFLACCELEGAPSECCQDQPVEDEWSKANCQRYNALIDNCKEELKQMPGPPEKVQVRMAGADSVIVIWDAPSNKGGNVFMYVVYYKKQLDDGYSAARTENMWVKLSDLEIGSEYNISIIAVDKVGHSSFTPLISKNVSLDDGSDVQGAKDDHGQRILDICTLPQEVGSCRALKLRFWYNDTSKKCEEFFYGGCEGNQNNFRRESQCIGMCIEEREIMPEVQEGEKTQEDNRHRKTHDENGAFAYQSCLALVFASAFFHLIFW